MPQVNEAPDAGVDQIAVNAARGRALGRRPARRQQQLVDDLAHLLRAPGPTPKPSPVTMPDGYPTPPSPASSKASSLRRSCVRRPEWATGPPWPPTNIDVWFCDPHSPWQRGQIENLNRQARWWFPRGTDSEHAANHQQPAPPQLPNTSRTVRCPHRALRSGRHLPAGVVERLVGFEGVESEGQVLRAAAPGVGGLQRVAGIDGREAQEIVDLHFARPLPSRQHPVALLTRKKTENRRVRRSDSGPAGLSV